MDDFWDKLNNYKAPVVVLVCYDCHEMLEVCSMKDWKKQGQQLTDEQRASCAPFVVAHEEHDWDLCPVQMARMHEA